MTEQVDFYVLDAGDRQDKLQYACRIIQKAYEQGLKVFVQSDDPDVNGQMDNLLWAFLPDSFIPHCICDAEEHSWQDYPVQLGTLQSGKSLSGEQCADVVVNLADAHSDSMFSFSRIVDLVSGEQTDRIAGRNRYRNYREKGYEPRTHKLGRK